jgi:hypothetical protein
LRYTLITSSSLALPREDYLGRSDAELFDNEDGARLTAIKEEVLRTRSESHAEVTLSLKGERHHFDLVVRTSS